MAVKWEQEIRRLALMCRHLSAFTGICDEDRMCLLKAGYREIIALRSLIAYNNDHRYWAVVLDSNNTTILKMETFKMIDENLFEIHKQFFTKFGGEWDFDTIILDLLIDENLFEIHKQFFTKFGGEWDFDTIILDLPSHCLHRIGPTVILGTNMLLNFNSKCISIYFDDI
ncbi:unnamed protein product [Oppiella nova]|uniref:NR LBD domain-containing protein n=1 Tax=Oppiella nova TaxID=334625 RepID=A0A7R9QWC5_9ACAR|nr:unnamed protein product [Oppiella nova]CAG2178037.1 unnamed protein product [Oppiella nova]